MLVIFSDIHLTDESTAINVAPEAFEILFDEILNNANDKIAKEIRIIMLGDIYDFVRTDYWLRLPRDKRPWNGNLDENTGMNSDPEIEQHFVQILNNIISTKSGKSFIENINALKDKVNIPVIVNYVIGNHDRAFNNFDSLKTLLEEKLDRIDKIEFLTSYYSSEYASLCRHGNEYDEHNFGFDLYNVLLNEADKEKNEDKFKEDVYKVITIGEVVTCELMSGLIYRVNEELKDPYFTKLLMDINNIRPMLNVFSWLYWYVKDLNKKKKDVIMKSFTESMKAVVESDLAKKWTKIKHLLLFQSDLVDDFKILLMLIDGAKFDDVSKYLEIAKTIEKILPEKDYCLKGAESEWEDAKYKDVQYIFFGHTHESRNDVIEGFRDGAVKLYVNTGTYLPYIEQAKKDKGFAEAFQMTMAFVYSRDEDTGGTKNKKYPSLDLWNGLKRKIYSIT